MSSKFANPIRYSHKANELEQAVASLFERIMIEHLDSSLSEMHNYGVPWVGGRTVVERFTKLNGLAVLRREDQGLSDTLMSIIYANWSALASERGLGFLQFILDMLYPEQNEIVRLWHSKKLASQYPAYLRENQATNSFLTSRIRIKLSPEVNQSELSELAPILTRLVPWQVVPQIAVGFDTEIQQLGIAAVSQSYHVANLSPY
ncbi:MAG: hypothetical protein Q4P13_05950 [Psychrobacter sp.]|nr:hypothetical protein [Psychrobacter sp.]